MALAVVSRVLISPTQVRVTLSGSTPYLSVSSGAGFTLNYNSAVIPVARVENAGPAAFDVIASSPMAFSGRSPTLAFDSSLTTISDGAALTLGTFSAAAIDDSALPAFAVADHQTPLLQGGFGNAMQQLLEPNVPFYIFVPPNPPGRIRLGFELRYANATITVSSSSDNGVADAYVARTVRDTTGTSASSLALTFGREQHYELETVGEEYIRFQTTAPAMLTIKSALPMTKLSGAGVP